MKIYLKSCSLYEVKNAAQFNLIDGICIMSENKKELCVATDSDMKSLANSIFGPVFISVGGTNVDEIITDCQQLLSMTPNIVVNVKASLEGFKACNLLSQKNVSVNVYGVRTLSHAVIAAKSGADFISIDVSKIDATGNAGYRIINDTLELIAKFGFQVEVIADNLDNKIDLESIVRTGVEAIQVSYTQFLNVMEGDI